VVEYEFYDKHPALDRDYKRNGLLRERVDVTHRQTLEELVTGANRTERDDR
jgi:hypothetical protein